MPAKLSKEIVIQRSNQIHQFKYSYPNFNYVNRGMTITIICPTHGPFQQTISDHLYNKAGCPKCKADIISQRWIKPFEFFKKKANIIHNNFYDYSEAEKIYVNSFIKVPIICPEHGEFWQSLRNHVNAKAGCPKCSPNCKVNKHQFIQRANDIHNNKYDYSKVEYTNMTTKVCIICTEHGEFWQTPKSHTNDAGCPKCRRSKGEEQIEQWLVQHNFKFIDQKRFTKCKDQQVLPFDFYLPKFNTCIEFDGEQHFKPVEYWGGEKQFKLTQFHDKIKNQFCEENDINLIRISYKDNIVSSLETTLLEAH